jgi:hypothetical protein
MVIYTYIYIYPQQQSLVVFIYFAVRNTLWALARLRQPALEAMPSGLTNQAAALQRKILVNLLGVPSGNLT